MDNNKTLKIARLRGSSIVKLIMLGSVIGFTLFTSVFGIAALFGVEVLQWNGQYVTGVNALLAAPFIGAFIGTILGLMSATFTYVGLRFYSVFRGISLEYVAPDNQTRSADKTEADSAIK